MTIQAGVVLDADTAHAVDTDTSEEAEQAGNFTREWEQWHAQHERQRTDEHGFLAITGIYWLDSTPTSIVGIPGLWSTGESGPVVALAENETLQLGEREVRGEYTFGLIPERGGITARAGKIWIEIARRGGNDIVRPRDPAYAPRFYYQGTDAFPAKRRWQVPGRYRPFASPRPTTVGSVADGLEHIYDAPGLVEFEIDGRPQSLTVFPGHTPDSLFALFTDATSGVTTYPANRSLNIDAPDEDGRVTIDFNRATNLPCAYTAFATCPLPPAENRLAVAIEAGEKKP